MYPVERLIIVRDFCGFLCSRGVRMPANFDVVVGVIRKIKMARNWFGHICVVFSYISLVFAKAVRKSSPCFGCTACRLRRQQMTLAEVHVKWSVILAD